MVASRSVPSPGRGGDFWARERERERDSVALRAVLSKSGKNEARSSRSSVKGTRHVTLLFEPRVLLFALRVLRYAFREQGLEREPATQPQYRFAFRLVCISAVSSPARTLGSSNDSRGPWLSRTLSIVQSPAKFHPLKKHQREFLNTVVGRRRERARGVAGAPTTRLFDISEFSKGSLKVGETTFRGGPKCDFNRIKCWSE